MPDGERSDDLAPDLAETVRRAQAELADAIDQGRLRDDPLRFPLMAISTLLRALHRLCVDFLLTLRRTLRDAQQPAPALSPEAQQKLLGLMAADAGRAVREATYRAQVSVVRAVNLASVAVIVAMIMAGVSAGFWWGWSSAAGRDIDTKSILGTMPAAKAAAWAQIISLNPPPSAWAQKPYRSGDGSMAVEIALRLTPIPTTPAAPASR